METAAECQTGCGRAVLCKGLCKSCYERQRLERDTAARDRRRAKNREYNKTAPKMLKSGRYYRTGFSVELYDACLAYQGGLCAICTGPSPDCADHHEPSGVKTPRGVLCRACNLSLGYYEGWQRQHGLRIEPYEKYLADPPVRQLQ